MRRCCIIGLAVLLFASVYQINAREGDDGDTTQTNRQVIDADEQGHEHTSGRKARQFGFPPPPFGPGFGGPGFGGGFDGGFGGGYVGGGFGGGFGGGYRQRVRVSERVRVRQRVRVNNGFGGGFYG